MAAIGQGAEQVLVQEHYSALDRGISKNMSGCLQTVVEVSTTAGTSGNAAGIIFWSSA